MNDTDGNEILYRDIVTELIRSMHTTRAGAQVTIDANPGSFLTSDLRARSCRNEQRPAHRDLGLDR